MNDFGRIEKRLQAAHRELMDAVDDVLDGPAGGPLKRLAAAKREYDAACKEVTDYMEGRIHQEMQGFADFLIELTAQAAKAGRPFHD